jgi:hypothetical protein
MSKLRIITISLLGLMAIACLGVILIESQTNIFRRLYDDIILDNKGHYLSCDELPTEAEVLAILDHHQDTIHAIENINPGLVGVEVDSSTCPGRADLVIWYASHRNRLEIEKIIGDDTFFGLPYRLQNR